MSAQARSSSRLAEHWISAEGIDRSVMQSEIHRFLGIDAICQLLNTSQGPMYKIRAVRNFTTAQLEDLKDLSRQWAAESKRQPGATSYTQSLARSQIDSSSLESDGYNSDRNTSGQYTGYSDRYNAAQPSARYYPGNASQYSQYCSAEYQPARAPRDTSVHQPQSDQFGYYDKTGRWITSPFQDDKASSNSRSGNDVADSDTTTAIKT